MLINNAQEFENFYPYDKKYIEEYPKEYPCVVKVESEGGGLMGDYKQVYIAYYPKNLNYRDTFLAGLTYNWKPLN